MPYYAIAIGREQKVTTDWQECFQLTNGYPNNKYKRFNTEEDAESWLYEINATMTIGLKNNYESEEHRLVPSFINTLTVSDYFSVKDKTEVYVSGMNLIRYDKMVEGFDSKRKSINFKHHSTVSSLISTLVPMDLEEDLDSSIRAGDSRLRNFIVSITNESFLTYNRQLMYIESAILAMEALLRHGIRSFSLITDSFYLFKILTSNVFLNKIAITRNVMNEEAIRRLYDYSEEFQKIYLSYFAGPSLPNKLSFTKAHSNINNEFYFEMKRTIEEEEAALAQKEVATSVEYDPLPF